MKYEVIIKTDLKDRPKDNELSAALILANHFGANAIFLRPQTVTKCHGFTTYKTTPTEGS